MPTFPEGLQLTLPFATPEQSVLARDAAESAYSGGSPLRRATVIPFRRVRTAIKHWPRGDRPPDKLLDRGPGALTNAELLSILLRTATRGWNPLDQARVLLAQCDDDWRKVGVLAVDDLRQCGIGLVQVTQILAVIEIAKRYGEHEFKLGVPLRSSADVYAHFRERLAEERVEHFIAVLLDNKHRKLKDVLVSKGSLTASIVDPRAIFAHVVREGAAALVLVHNIPGGSAAPSKEDIEITRRLREVGELMGVRVLDHIIIGKGRYVSMVDSGYW